MIQFSEEKVKTHKGLCIDFADFATLYNKYFAKICKSHKMRNTI